MTAKYLVCGFVQDEGGQFPVCTAWRNSHESAVVLADDWVRQGYSVRVVDNQFMDTFVMLADQSLAVTEGGR